MAAVTPSRCSQKPLSSNSLKSKQEYDMGDCNFDNCYHDANEYDMCGISDTTELRYGGDVCRVEEIILGTLLLEQEKLTFPLVRSNRP